MRANRRTLTGSVLGGLIALTLIAGLSAAATATAGSQAARSLKISASLSEAPFAPSEVNSVQVLFHLSTKSTGFGYRLSVKKGSTWRVLKSVTLRGSFKGSRSLSAGKLFPKRRAIIGHYRVELRAGTAHTTLYFDVVKALKISSLAVAAGGSHSCTIVAGGGAKCWGSNGRGELGNNSTANSATPVTANSLRNAKALSAGGFTTCAVISNGAIKCWGDNAYGKLGTGQKQPSFSSFPVAVSGMKYAVAVSSGADHSCALLAGGTVRCWGRNNSGDLGRSKSSTATPLNVPKLAGVTAISAGSRHTCALRSSGKVVCWGNNHLGQLGNGKTTDSTKPVTVSGLTKVIGISAGNDHSCAVLANHTIKCWGRGDTGALGDQSTNHGHKDKSGIDFRPTPVAVKGIASATSVSAGAGFSCARLSSKQIWCWGDNSSGQLGNGATADSSIPQPVSGISAAVAVSAGDGSIGKGHACALVSGSKVKCWGSNDVGQLGSGSQNFSATPVGAVITSASAIAAGGVHSCALLSNGTVACWGDNSAGQLGNGSTTTSATPVPVSTITGANSIAAGLSHSCAVLSTGDVDCWGDNSAGQLGNGSTTRSPTPVAVSPLGATAKAVAAGSSHSCALLSDGTIKCWGDNSAGQLGNGSTTASTTPVAVSPLSTTAKAVSTGRAHSCALLTDGKVECWGDNSAGQLGNGSTTTSATPVPVSTITDAKAVAAGYDHSCALLSNGTIKCWGANTAGQLGNGSTTASSTPVAVSNVTGALTISAGASYSCAVLATGAVACWGDASDGKLGNGSTTSSSTPVAVADITGALEVSVGASHSCTLLTSGAVRCWGSNAAGELGVAALNFSSSPVTVVGIP